VGRHGKKGRGSEQLWGRWIEWSVDSGRVHPRGSLKHFGRAPACFDATTSIVFGFSAKTPEAVEQLRSHYLTHLRSTSGLTSPSLRDFAYTSTARRQLYPHRVSITAESLDSLTSSLESALPNHVVSVKKIAFVFSGQSAPYLGMGRQLYWTNEVFRCHVHECQRILEGLGFSAMIKWISDGPSVSGPPSPARSLLAQAGKVLSDPGSNDGFETFQEYQTAVFAIGYSLAKLWISWASSRVS